MHCSRRERESLLGIKSKLWQWELSKWEWPCRRGCERGKQFPRISHCQPSGCCVARTHSAWCLVSKEMWIPTNPTSEPVWGQALRASSGSFPADTLSPPQQGVSLVMEVIASNHSSLLSSSIWLHRGLDYSWGDWSVLDYPEKKGGEWWWGWHLLSMLSKQRHYVIIPLEHWS